MAGQAMMALLWPIGSLRDALVYTFETPPQALGGRNRLRVAAGAWSAALRWNLPPVDYLGYRLFEPGRPGPGHWLHSADAHVHFSAIASPEVRALAADKLAFNRFAEEHGAPVVPILAALGPGGKDLALEAPLPPVDLLVKPRRGFGGVGHTVWHWDGDRHSAREAGIESDLAGWLEAEAQSSDIIVQPVAQPPSQLGHIEPDKVPVVMIITVAAPNGDRAVAYAVLNLRFILNGAPKGHGRVIDIASGDVQPPAPGQLRPLWAPAVESVDLGGLSILGWTGILAEIDRLHAAMPGRAPVLKWDVLLTDAGPRILEVNTGTGAYGPQAMTLRPLTETPLGAVLEAWAR